MTPETTEHKPAAKTDTAPLPKSQKDWVEKTGASKKAPSIDIERPEEPKEPQNFWQRIAPKSKKGRVVFAACSAQVVSIALVACAGYYFKHHKPKVVRNFEKALVKQFNKMAENYETRQRAKDHVNEEEVQKGHRLLRPKGWKAFMDYGDYQRLKCYDGLEYTNKRSETLTQKARPKFKHNMQAQTLTEFIIMGLTNIISTITVRNLLDKKLDINLGGNKVFKTQMIDTAVGIGAMFGIPQLAPKYARDARLGVRNLVKKWPVSADDPVALKKKQDRLDRIGQALGFSAVNIALPDFIGFVAGINATFRELDAQEKEQKAEQRVKAVEAAHDHGRG